MSQPQPKPGTEDDRHARPFAAFLQETNGGRTHQKLSDDMHELVEAVLRTGKAGSLTLTVKVDPDDVDARRLVISEQSTTKLPQTAPKKSIFWANSDGNLQRTDPIQMQFGDLRAAGERNDR